MMRIETVSNKNIAAMCRDLAERDEHFALVLNTYGTPPLWDRPAGFVTLPNIILEQQVSLASAKACFDTLYSIRSCVLSIVFLYGFAAGIQHLTALQ